MIINRPNVTRSSPQIRCVCLKNETVGVVGLLSVCCCTVTLFLCCCCFFFSSTCVCLHVSMCVCVKPFIQNQVFLMYQKNFFLSDFSSNLLILLYFNSMPLDRNTLPKKGLRYRTHADADPDLYCIYPCRFYLYICMAIISKIQSFHVFACVACFFFTHFDVTWPNDIN